MKRTISPKKKELMNAKIYRAVKHMIAVHRFQAGLNLNVEKTAREMGVSRTPVWEAIRRLEQEGIVQNIPNRGVFLLEIPIERALEIMEVRGNLDKFAGRLACERINDRMLNKLTQCLPDQLRAIETGDVALYSAADLRFHGLIYEASGNSYLKKLFESITLHMQPARLEILPILPSLYLGHQEIIKGLASRDPGRVETAIMNHIEIAINHLKDQLQSSIERKKMVQRLRKNTSFLRGSKKNVGKHKQG
jgi:DNA-binding GntR family transcriptional regulator